MVVENRVGNAHGHLQRVVVVGSGVAGLMTTIKLCESGIAVDLVSLSAAKRSPSVLDRDGINVATSSDNDSPANHFEDTIVGGDFLANQPLVESMTHAASGIVSYLQRLGVPFDRTDEGLLAFRRSTGSSATRTAFAGDTTGMQIVNALDSQVRRFESATLTDARGVSKNGNSMVRRWEGWELLRFVIDDTGRCIGVVVQDLRTSAVCAIRASAVCVATGGLGLVFGRCTGGMSSTGSAVSIAAQQGAILGNAEFIQVHPSAIPGASKYTPLSESVCAAGGRYWVPKDASDTRHPHLIAPKERDYFLERMCPTLGNLAPLDVAARAVFAVCYHEGRGFFDSSTGAREIGVYLDVSHLPERILRGRLHADLTAYQRLTGVDPCYHAMKVSPAVSYSMGGLWVDYECDANGSILVGSPRNHATSVPGMYAVGEADYAYHGANRIGSNSLLSCLFGGSVTGSAISSYVESLRTGYDEAPSSVFEAAECAERKEFERIVSQNQSEKKTESPWGLHTQLSESMFQNCSIERSNDRLDETLSLIDATCERLKRVRAPDQSSCVNQGAQFIRWLENMVVIARVIAESAKHRSESRGAHYKPSHPKRNDRDWLHSTLARLGTDRRVEFVRSFDYECAGRVVHVSDTVDVKSIKPRDRNYE